MENRFPEEYFIYFTSELMQHSKCQIVEISKIENIQTNDNSKEIGVLAIICLSMVLPNLIQAPLTQMSKSKSSARSGGSEHMSNM